MATFMSIVDTQVVIVALATVQDEFGADTSDIQWVATSYLLSLAVVVPVAGWLGDRFGTKRIFLLAGATFSLASAACALVPNFELLIVARAVQGIGGGMMIPTTQATLYRAYPQEERIRVARSVAKVTLLAPSVAPILGGLLVTTLSWHWVFLVNVPIGLAMFTYAAWRLGTYRAPVRTKPDLLGAALGGGGLATLLYALSQAPQAGWLAPHVVAAGLTAVVSLTWFIRRQLRREQPILKLRLLHDRMLRRACAVAGCLSVALFGTITFMALYLQQGRGMTALESGLTTFPCAVGMLISAQITSRVYPFVGPRRLMAAGFAAMGALSIVMAVNGGSADVWIVRSEMFLFGLAVPLVMMPTQASVFAGVSISDTGHATSIYNSVQRSSTAAGLALLATVLGLAAGSSVEVAAAEDFLGVHLAVVGVATVGLIAALRVRDRDALPTMRPTASATGGT
jgi:EmrB/QacA subfamily drug resistance transporter